jgi:hypothetical protein
MEVKEINNLSTQHTIRDIAQRTAEDQAVAHRFETWPLLAQHAPQPSKTARPSVMKNNVASHQRSPKS